MMENKNLLLTNFDIILVTGYIEYVHCTNM